MILCVGHILKALLSQTSLLDEIMFIIFPSVCLFVSDENFEWSVESY